MNQIKIEKILENEENELAKVLKFIIACALESELKDFFLEEMSIFLSDKESNFMRSSVVEVKQIIKSENQNRKKRK